MNEIGKRLKDLREKRGITSAYAADFAVYQKL